MDPQENLTRQCENLSSHINRLLGSPLTVESGTILSLDQTVKEFAKAIEESVIHRLSQRTESPPQGQP